MERFVIIKIISDDNDRKYCSEYCSFLESIYDHCKLFSADLCEDTNNEKYLRCASCLEKEM